MTAFHSQPVNWLYCRFSLKEGVRRCAFHVENFPGLLAHTRADFLGLYPAALEISVVVNRGWSCRSSYGQDDGASACQSKIPSQSLCGRCYDGRWTSRGCSCYRQRLPLRPTVRLLLRLNRLHNNVLEFSFRDPVKNDA